MNVRREKDTMGSSKFELQMSSADGQIMVKMLPTKLHFSQRYSLSCIYKQICATQTPARTHTYPLNRHKALNS